MTHAKRILLFVLTVTLCLPVFKVEAAEKVFNNRTITADTFGKEGKYIKILYLGPDVREIDANASTALPRLQKIVVDTDNPYFASFDGCLYNKNKTKLLYMPPRSTSHWYPTSMSSFTASSMADTTGSETSTVEAVISDNVIARKIIADAKQKEADQKKAEADKKKEEARKKKEEEDKRKKAEADEKKKNSCTVAFDPDGGRGAMAPISVEKDTPYRMPECKFEAPKDKRFKRWQIGDAEEEDDAVYVRPGSYHIFSDDVVIVYAVWEDIKKNEDDED